MTQDERKAVVRLVRAIRAFRELQKPRTMKLEYLQVEAQRHALRLKEAAFEIDQATEELANLLMEV